MTFQRQTPNSPLFPDLLWSKPENKSQAGKLLIIGGNSFGFSAVAEAYNVAVSAGAGEVRVLLPDAIQKIAGGVFENAIFAQTNPSGSFSNDALHTCLEAAIWADGVLIVGDVSRNAEAASLLERFCNDYSGSLTVTKDALELLLKQSSDILNRPDTNLIMTMADLQIAAKQLRANEPLTHESPIDIFADRLVKMTNSIQANIIVKRAEFIYVASQSQLSLTKVEALDSWRVATSTKCAIWHLQNPSKPFEALTTSLIDQPI